MDSQEILALDYVQSIVKERYLEFLIKGLPAPAAVVAAETGTIFLMSQLN